MNYTDREIALFESSYVHREAQLKEYFQLALKDLEKTYQQTFAFASYSISPTGAAYDAVLERLTRMRSFFLSKADRNIDPDLRRQIHSSISAFEETLARILQDIDWRIQDMVNRGARLSYHQGHFNIDAPTHWTTPVEQFNEQRSNQNAWQGYAERLEPDESPSANKQANQPVEDPLQRIHKIREQERKEIQEHEKKIRDMEIEHQKKMAEIQRAGNERIRLAREKLWRR